MNNDLFIIGAGGLGREISASLLHHDLQNQFRVRGFIDDALPPAEVAKGTPVQGDMSWLLDQPQANVVIALGNPVIRFKVYQELSAGNHSCPSIVHPGASLHNQFFITIGQGCYMADGCILLPIVGQNALKAILHTTMVNADIYS